MAILASATESVTKKKTNTTEIGVILPIKVSKKAFKVKNSNMTNKIII